MLWCLICLQLNCSYLDVSDSYIYKPYLGRQYILKWNKWYWLFLLRVWTWKLHRQVKYQSRTKTTQFTVRHSTSVFVQIQRQVVQVLYMCFISPSHKYISSVSPSNEVSLKLRHVIQLDKFISLYIIGHHLYSKKIWNGIGFNCSRYRLSGNMLGVFGIHRSPRSKARNLKKVNMKKIKK